MDRESNQELRLTIQRLARRIRSNAPDNDIPESQRSVLFTLGAHGSQSLGSLSEHERVTPPSMNRTVNALVASGHITRTADEEDARRIHIDLTDSGQAFVNETKKRRDAWFTLHLASLSTEQRATLEKAIPVLKELAEK